MSDIMILLVVELLLIAALPCKNIVVNLFFILFSLVFSLQVSAFLFSGEFVTPLAISNLSEANKIGIKPIIYFVCSLITIVIVSGLYHFILNKIVIKNDKNRINKLALLIYIFLLVIFHNSTFHSLHKSLRIYRKEVALINNFDKTETIKSLTKSEVVYNSRATDFIANEKYNVILIFTEGMSRAVISPTVTPSIYRLTKKSIDVIHYYNHTAATFRGLRGQLISGYQMSGGYNSYNLGIGQLPNNKVKSKFSNSTISLADILSQNGYATFFQASTSIKEPLYAMLSTLGFDAVYGQEDKKYREEWLLDALSDKDSYQLLYNKIIHKNTPFFYAIYTIGTHVGMDSPDIKFKDGKNSYLNKFYNLDAQFGSFFKKFNNSPLATNTILIFTTDHASYPDPEFKKTFNTKSEFFVDEIPLMIYKKGVKPVKIDVKGLNSLSLAPTILDILGIHRAKNRFIGVSIFDKKKPRKENRISAIGTLYFTTKNNNVVPETNKSIVAALLNYQLFGG